MDNPNYEVPSPADEPSPDGQASLKDCVELFLRDGMTTETAKETLFENLVATLKNPEVIKLAKSCFSKIHRVLVETHGPFDVSFPGDRVNVRVVLSVYLVVCYPTKVFEFMGDLEKNLFQAGSDFMLVCDALFACISSGREIKLPMAKEYLKCLEKYIMCFVVWKIPDEEKLAKRIMHALTALTKSLADLPKDEPDISRLKSVLIAQIQQMTTKLSTIVGPEVAQNLIATLPISASTQDGGDIGGVGDIGIISNELTNEQMAHELLYNPDFELGAGGNPIFMKVQDRFHREFWNSLVSDIRIDPPCYTRILSVLRGVGEGIIELGPLHDGNGLLLKSRVGQISDVIDVDLLRQKINEHALSWEYATRLVQGIVEVIKTIQKADRVEETERKWAEIRLKMEHPDIAYKQQAFVDSLEFLVGCINVTRIDAANARLHLISPVVQEHGLEYERGKFQDKLAGGTLTLDSTKLWLKDVLGKMPCVVTLPVDCLRSIITGGVVTILAGDKVDHSNVPATLLLDLSRLTKYQKEFHQIAKAATFISVIRMVIPSMTREADNIISDCLIETRLVDVNCVISATAAAGITPPPKLLEMLEAITSSDPVYVLIVGRLSTLLYLMISGLLVLHDLGLQNMIPQIKALAIGISPLVKLNTEVHGTTYNTIIGEIVASLSADGDL